MTLWAREDGWEGAAKSFINRVIPKSIACEAFVELVLGGMKNSVKVLRSILLFGGLKIIGQNYGTGQSGHLKKPPEISGLTPRHPDNPWNHSIGRLPCRPLLRDMVILKKCLQGATNADCKFAFLVIMLTDLVPEHRGTAEQLQYRVPVAVIESVVKPLHPDPWFVG